MDGRAVGWEEAYSKARAFVSQLTLLEKVNLTTGVGWEGEQCVGQVGSIPRLGFRSLCMQDSPVGVRDTDYNSVFSSGQSVAATFDRGMMYARGYAVSHASVNFIYHESNHSIRWAKSTKVKELLYNLVQSQAQLDEPQK